MKKLVNVAVALGVFSGVALAETDYKAMKVLNDIRKGVDNANQIVDLRVQDDATIGGDATVAGTFGVTGNTTLGGSLDVDSVTVDAGAGIDSQAAGTLKVGESTATKVEIADTGVETEVQGSLDVLGTASLDGDATVEANADLVAVSDDGSDTNSVVSDGQVLAHEVVWTVAAGVSVTNAQVVTLRAGEINGLTSSGAADAATNTITLANFAARDVGKITYLFNNASATNALQISKTGNFYGDTIVLGAGDSMAIFPGATNILYGK